MGTLDLLNNCSTKELKTIAKENDILLTKDETRDTIIAKILAWEGGLSGFTFQTQLSTFKTASEFNTNDQSEFTIDNQSQFTITGDPSEFQTKDKAEKKKLKRKSHHSLEIEQKISLKKKEYSVKEIISKESNKSTIYKVVDAEQNIFALKLYRQLSDTKMEPNPEALQRISEVMNPHLLKLHEFGIGEDKFEGKYCFELLDLALGGDLRKVEDFKSHYSPSYIENTIVPAFNIGINAIHRKKVIHGDLKPANIFYLDAEKTHPVIGDYGSAKTMKLSSQGELKDFSAILMTKVYAAPEQTDNVMSEKSDYFSLGMILVHLLYPEHFAKDEDYSTPDRGKVSAIKVNMYAGKNLIPFNPEYKRLNQLIRGLTLVNHRNRWGKQELERWLRGQPKETKPEVVVPEPVKQPILSPEVIKYGGIAAGILVILMLFTFIISSFSGSSEWEEAENENTEEAYLEILKNDPSADLKEKAEEAISILKQDSIWGIIKSENSWAELDAYSSEYPNGKYLEQIKEKKEKFAESDVNAWDLMDKDFVGKIRRDNLSVASHLDLQKVIKDNASEAEFKCRVNLKGGIRSEEAILKLNFLEKEAIFYQKDGRIPLEELSRGRFYVANNKIILESIDKDSYWNFKEI